MDTAGSIATGNRIARILLALPIGLFGLLVTFYSIIFQLALTHDDGPTDSCSSIGPYTTFSGTLLLGLTGLIVATFLVWSSRSIPTLLKYAICSSLIGIALVILGVTISRTC